MSDVQRASILRTLQASDIWMALRLPANAAADVVRQAFRKESRLLHPDKNPMPEAEAQVSHSAPTACTTGLWRSHERLRATASSLYLTCLGALCSPKTAGA